jgi:hypothetical protein
LVIKDTVTSHVVSTDIALPVLSEPETKAVEQEKKDTVAQVTEEKKKTFGQVLKGLFKKKKKNQEQPANTTSADTSSNQ